MNKYRILTAALSSKATVDDFTFCRSSDLFLLQAAFPENVSSGMEREFIVCNIM